MLAEVAATHANSCPEPQKVASVVLTVWRNRLDTRHALCFVFYRVGRAYTGIRMMQHRAISLLEWLRTGFFGPLRFGQTRAEVAMLLGPPDDVGGTSRKYRRPSIWKYGDFELYFWPGDDALSGIQTDDFTFPHGGPRIQILPWQLRGGISQQRIAEALTPAGIAYHIAAPPRLAGATQIITASGVWLNFEAESAGTGEAGGLYAMGQSAQAIGT